MHDTMSCILFSDYYLMKNKVTTLARKTRQTVLHFSRSPFRLHFVTTRILSLVDLIIITINQAKTQRREKQRAIYIFRLRVKQSLQERMATECSEHAEEGLSLQTAVEHACTATSGEDSASQLLKTDCTSPRGSESLAEHAEIESAAGQRSANMSSSDYYIGGVQPEDSPEPVLSLRMLMTSKVS